MGVWSGCVWDECCVLREVLSRFEEGLVVR